MKPNIYRILILMGFLSTSQMAFTFADTVLYPKIDQRTLEEFKEECPPIVFNGCDYTSPPISSSCVMSDFKILGRMDEFEIYEAQFTRTKIFDWPEAHERNPQSSSTHTCVAVETFILEKEKSTGLPIPVWLGSADPEGLVPYRVNLYNPKGYPVMAIIGCFNGTGGCFEIDYIRVNSKWISLEKDETWDKAYKDIPKGYERHKSSAIDFKRLCWDENFSKPEDANCCPSGWMHFELDIVNDKISVKSHAFSIKKDY